MTRSAGSSPRRRPTSRAVSGLTSTWTYDTQPKGIGKPATAATNAATGQVLWTANARNAEGQLTQQTQGNPRDKPEGRRHLDELHGLQQAVVDHARHDALHRQVWIPGPRKGRFPPLLEPAGDYSARNFRSRKLPAPRRRRCLLNITSRTPSPHSAAAWQPGSQAPSTATLAAANKRNDQTNGWRA
jgi:hypothetical protein